MRPASSFLLALVLIPHAVVAQRDAIVGHRVSTSGTASVLVLERADGETERLVIRNGALTLDGTPVAAPVTDAFRRAWDELVREAWRLEPSALLDRLATLPDADPALEDHVRSLRAAVPTGPSPTVRPAPAPVADPAPVTEPSVAQRAERLGIEASGTVRTGDVTIRRGQTVDGDLTVLDGDVSVFGRIEGDLTVMNGDLILRENGEVRGNVRLRGGDVIDQGGRIGGRVRRVSQTPSGSRQVDVSWSGNGISLVSLVSVFVALAGMGFGFTFYLPRQLDLLSGTVRDASGKAFLAGLFAQPLMFPVLGVGVIGLAITVVGILLIPLAVLALLLALGAVATAGYLAVARALGDHYVTRRMARGLPTRATPFRSLLYGLAGLLAVWLPAVVVGSVPILGQIATIAALVVTWAVATTGLGAAVLSQAGLRATFAKPTAAALTDEHFWLPAGSDRER